MDVQRFYAFNEMVEYSGIRKRSGALENICQNYWVSQKEKPDYFS